MNGLNTYYHVTTKQAWENHIQTEGLLPQIGERAKEFGEGNPRVYLFSSYEAYEDAMLQWLGECFELDCEEEDCHHEKEDDICIQPLVLLKVVLPLHEFEEFMESEVAYEITVSKAIPTNCISFVEEA